MIIINLKGGLGNQMFQYAFGRAFSLRHNIPFKLDISGYPKQDLRTYDLHAFDIEENIASEAEIRAIKYPLGILSKIWRGVRAKIFRKFYIGFDPSIMKMRDNYYFDGFFQSERYFEDVASIIRKDFSPASPLPSHVQQLTDRIKSNPNSVSMHIRRGDYTRGSTLSYHGIVGADYYNEAVGYIKESLGDDLALYVFSDDIAWARENLSFGIPTEFVSGQSIKDQEELILMAACSHNIIANSTFSWWGAWLNNNADKIVIAPKKWLANKAEPLDTIPKSWIRI